MLVCSSATVLGRTSIGRLSAVGLGCSLQLVLGAQVGSVAGSPCGNTEATSRLVSGQLVGGCIVIYSNWLVVRPAPAAG